MRIAGSKHVSRSEFQRRAGLGVGGVLLASAALGSTLLAAGRATADEQVAPAVPAAPAASAPTATPLRERLRAEPAKIAWEAYVDGNSEIFVMNADGSGAVNLTRTPHEHEHYPQISPDGRRICYTIDSGEGRDAVRSLWVMDVNGKNRRKIADRAREPFWSPDGKVIAYLPQEYPKFDVIDYYTKGLVYYHLDTGDSEPHPNSGKLRHLYHPRFAPNGNWIVSTVHGGMGFSHAILAIEAHGDKIVNLKIPGCRPTVSPDGSHIAWGSSDHELDTAPIHWEGDPPGGLPSVGKPRWSA